MFAVRRAGVNSRGEAPRAPPRSQEVGQRESHLRHEHHSIHVGPRDVVLFDREIFRLCASEGYAYQAAADQLGVAHGVVRNRLSRIRTRLRTTVKEST